MVVPGWLLRGLRTALVRCVMAFLMAMSLLVGAQAQDSPLVKQELRPAVLLEVTKLQQLPGKQIVELRFDVTNQSASVANLADLGLVNEGWVNNVVLLDWKSAQVYSVGWFNSGQVRYFCSYVTGAGPIQPGQRMDFWAWFGAPPAGVTNLALRVPGVPPVDIPLTR